ncbi:MAG: hypothetical protein WBF88_07410 [Pusillimonas sp.]
MNSWIHTCIPQEAGRRIALIPFQITRRHNGKARIFLAQAELERPHLRLNGKRDDMPGILEAGNDRRINSR